MIVHVVHSRLERVLAFESVILSNPVLLRVSFLSYAWHIA